MEKKIRQFVLALCLLAVPFTSTLAQDNVNPYYADLNEDGVVDVADIANIVDVIANGEIQDLSPESALAIDMGFPSGTMWANMNVGANKPEDYGLFYAWAETTGYGSDISDGRLFRWRYYKWMTKGKNKGAYINKYQLNDNKTEGCWYDSAGNFIGDNIPMLEAEDDAATANWGTKWRIPTYYEMEELVEFCTTEWVEMNGVNGMMFTSKINGNSIFLPAAGYRLRNSLDYQGEGGNYWTSTLLPTDCTYAGSIAFGAGGASMYYNGRLNGRSVRPVIKK